MGVHALGVRLQTGEQLEGPERLANVVGLSLSKRPETRYQDGGQFAADLRSVLDELSGLARPVASFEATVVGAAMPEAAAPSYDATHHGAGPDTDAFERTAVIRPGEPGSPAPGDGKTDVGA